MNAARAARLRPALVRLSQDAMATAHERARARERLAALSSQGGEAPAPTDAEALIAAVGCEGNWHVVGGTKYFVTNYGEWIAIQ